jgi:hypothetical protein
MAAIAGNKVGVVNGVPNTGTGDVSTIDALMADGGQATLGAKADAKSTATDTTAVSGISIWKQISASVQALVTGALTVGTAGSASTQVVSMQGIASMTPVATGGLTITQAASSTVTRPADTTAYTLGDLVANSVTAGSVAALQFTTLARVSGSSGVIVGASIQKSVNTVTASLRLHLFNTIPTFTSAGDNSAMTTVVVASGKGYLGYIDIPTFVGFSDVAWGTGAPDNSRGSIPYVATAQIIYGILEARNGGTWTPGTGEVFTVTLDALQD